MSLVPILREIKKVVPRGIRRYLSRHYDPTRVIDAVLRGGPVFFVQIGSNDGMHDDPLRSLILKHPGWGGILVEPVPYAFERLKKNYAGRPNLHFENVAVSDCAGFMPFYYVSEAALDSISGLPKWYDQLGSFDRSHIVKHLGGALEPFIVEQPVPTKRLADVLLRNPGRTVDLLHIDAEGHDYAILSQVDFHQIRPRVILYEHVHLSDLQKRTAEASLKHNGYRILRCGNDSLAIQRTIRSALAVLKS
jgi:FkbM family methyltransferase